MISPSDQEAVEAQLGRAPRAIAAVAHRCRCGLPDVVTTEPRLPDGTPFPTTYYLTCPRAASMIGTLEGSGLMKEMEARLASDAEELLAASHAAAHHAYLADRATLAAEVGQSVTEIEGISAGGMPDRVKCLHVLAAHALAAGRDVNPLGDEVLEALGPWWRADPVPDCVAAFDCGTNTIKLLIGALPDVAVRESRIVRLGQGVDATGRLAEQALERAFAAIDEYAALVAAHPVTATRFCATSATRDSSNAHDFATGVHERLGVWPEVLSGQEEAALAYDGAVRNLRTPPNYPVLVIDIGGGSTELVLGDASGPMTSQSMDIGSVRMHERHLTSDPPTSEQVAACVADIDAHLDACPVPVSEAATVVGVAGTTLSITAGVLDLPTYDKDVIDQSVIPADAVHAFVDRLVAMPIAQRLEFPWMHPGRVDVLGAGGLILSRVLARCSTTTLVASEADILDGIAWSLVR